MRSCAFCGRDLGPEEKCNCPGAERARMSKDAGNTENKTYSGWQENTYTTGYTKEKKKRFNFKKPRFKKPNFAKPDFKGSAKGVSGFTKRFMRDPVNAVANPGVLSPLQIVLILLGTALAVSFCGFFMYIRLLSPVMRGLTSSSHLLGTDRVFLSYKIGSLLKFVLSGFTTVTLMEFAFIGVLFVVNKFLLKHPARFFVFATRPAAAMIPVMVFSALGALISFFSIFASAMLFMTGIVINIVLMYEALRSEWSSMPAARAVYTMALSYFVFYVIIFNILRIG